MLLLYVVICTNLTVALNENFILSETHDVTFAHTVI
jgi:hypothetical protein